MSMKVHNLGKINLIVGGIVPTGLAKGDDCITAEYDEDAWTVQTGADGEACADKNLSKSGKVTVKLMATSLTNPLFSAMFYVQYASGVPLPIFMSDGLGTSVVEAPTAMFQKMPAWVEGQNSGTVSWTFLVSDMYLFLGGNFTQGIA
jgi:hypothetical protein